MNADSLRSAILNQVYTEERHMVILVSLIIFAGFIGGVISWIFRNEVPSPINSAPINQNDSISTAIRDNLLKEEMKKYPLWNSILVSLGGAFIIPLFLNLGGNGLLQEKTPQSYLAFTGFCILGAVFARDFLNSMGKTLIRKVDELDKKIDEKIREVLKEKERAEKQSSEKILDSAQLLRKEIDKKIEGIHVNIEGMDERKADHPISENLKILPIEEIDKKILESKPQRITKKAPYNDPQKHQWGGKPIRNGKELSATVKKLQEFWYEINVEVKTLDASKPLEGAVILYVHDSFNFKDDRIILEVDDDGVAREELRAYGAFTIGAVCDNGDTWLEYDLVDAPGADEDFKNN